MVEFYTLYCNTEQNVSIQLISIEVFNINLFVHSFTVRTKFIVHIKVPFNLIRKWVNIFAV